MERKETVRWTILETGLVAGWLLTVQKKQPSNLLGCFGAEEEGFEPPVPRGTTVFKTAAFDHSATPLDVISRLGLQR